MYSVNYESLCIDIKWILKFCRFWGLGWTWVVLGFEGGFSENYLSLNGLGWVLVYSLLISMLLVDKFLGFEGGFLENYLSLNGLGWVGFILSLFLYLLQFLARGGRFISFSSPVMQVQVCAD